MAYVLQKISGLTPDWYIESETHICKRLCDAKSFQDTDEITKFWVIAEIADHEYNIVEIADKTLFKVRLLGR